uniref:(northern house mosquito) hypothetical protein n=1 Tax=Culex pipiens TaxID=7175 RepID=A0A8D8DZ09_CULPI
MLLSGRLKVEKNIEIRSLEEASYQVAYHISYAGTLATLMLRCWRLILGLILLITGTVEDKLKAAGSIKVVLAFAFLVPSRTSTLLVWLTYEVAALPRFLSTNFSNHAIFFSRLADRSKIEQFT